MSKLTQKIALVMGASKHGNMGQVIAARLIKEGAIVIVSGRDCAQLDEFVAAHQENAIAITCDITDELQVSALCNEIKNKFGQLDILVQASGNGLNCPLLEVTKTQLNDIVQLQLNAPFHLFQQCIPLFTKGGSIIQISSATASIMLEDYAPYMITKAATDHLIRIIANEFGCKGIRANSISPGLTDTPMTTQALDIPGLKEAFSAQYPLGRIGDSDDIAEAVVFLSSDKCFMTGENLQVNGGLTLRGNPSSAQIGESIAKASN
jgi:NAD(P)-dependent dehydrogenase (short-subunit alcohol dehydrogenase family)